MSATATLAAASALLEFTNIAAGAILQGQKIAALIKESQEKHGGDVPDEMWAALNADLEAAFARLNAVA